MLIRPRAGDFVYTAAELGAMLDDVAAAKRAQAGPLGDVALEVDGRRADAGFVSTNDILTSGFFTSYRNEADEEVMAITALAYARCKEALAKHRGLMDMLVDKLLEV